MGHEDQKKLAKRPKIPQGKEKPAAKGEAPKDTKTQRSNKTGQKVDRPQVYGYCSVDQVSSHRDYCELLAIIFSKFAKQIKQWMVKLKY